RDDPSQEGRLTPPAGLPPSSPRAGTTRCRFGGFLLFGGHSPVGPGGYTEPARAAEPGMEGLRLRRGRQPGQNPCRRKRADRRAAPSEAACGGTADAELRSLLEPRVRLFATS